MIILFMYEAGLSLKSRAHFVDLIFQKWAETRNFLRFLCEMELSLQSRAHFVDLIFQKCPGPLSYLQFSSVKSKCRYSPARFL